MENHPIPQDVTGFQFKLIGNMTVKQFAYLVVGVILAWVLLQLPVSILIKLPFSICSALLGIGLAFFPISGRPMDLMIGNYIKALFRPTQFIYEKIGGQIYFPQKTTPLVLVKQYKNAFSPFPQDKLKLYLQSLDTKPKNKVDEKENNFLISVTSLATHNPSLQPSANPILNTPPINPPKQNLPSAAPVQPTPAPSIAGTQSPFLKPMPIPDAPNLITGVTRDSRGNPLSNILIEIKDKEGNPVRAFKTNELGRFASATSLLNGSYTVEFEDLKGQNKFEKIIINVSGQIIAPLVAVSIDTREELRRSLFSPDASGLNN